MRLLAQCCQNSGTLNLSLTSGLQHHWRDVCAHCSQVGWLKTVPQCEAGSKPRFSLTLEPTLQFHPLVRMASGCYAGMCCHKRNSWHIQFIQSQLEAPGLSTSVLWLGAMTGVLCPAAKTPPGRSSWRPGLSCRCPVDWDCTPRPAEKALTLPPCHGCTLDSDQAKRFNTFTILFLKSVFRNMPQTCSFNGKK